MVYTSGIPEVIIKPQLKATFALSDNLGGLNLCALDGRGFPFSQQCCLFFSRELNIYTINILEKWHC